MQKGGQKFDTIGSTRFHNTMWNKLAQIAHPNTLRDPYILFSLKVQPYLSFMTRTPKSKPYIVTLPKYIALMHWLAVYAILSLC